MPAGRGHPRRMKMGDTRGAARGEVDSGLGTVRPWLVGPGSPRHPELSLRARRSDSLSEGLPKGGVHSPLPEGGLRGAPDRALLRARRAQGHRDCLRARPGPAWQPRRATGRVLDDDAGSAGAVGLAQRSGGHAGGDGGHRRLLEAGLLPARGRFRAVARQRGPHQARAWPQTDVQDAQWIAQLLEHGLLRGSFVPPREIRELRDLTRYRKSLIRERQREANRLHKLLEDANIKLASGGHRRARRLGPLDAQGAARGRVGSRGAGGARPRQAAQEAPRPAPAAAGALLRPPRAAALAHPLPPRLPGGRDRGALGGDRAPARPFRA
jgi:Transposase